MEVGGNISLKGVCNVYSPFSTGQSTDNDSMDTLMYAAWQGEAEIEGFEKEQICRSCCRGTRRRLGHWSKKGEKGDSMITTLKKRCFY